MVRHVKRNSLGSGIAGICILTLLLCGCGAKPLALSGTDTATLRVVTEKTTSDGMNQQLEAAKIAFQESFPNVTVEVQTLPTEEGPRQEALETLADQMAAGEGPDVFLLPTRYVLTLEEPQPYTYVRVTPAIQDVNLAMAEGKFLDISSWYDRDETLGKEALNAAVMEAGMVEGRRYVLPLRFDAPVIYEWEGYFAENGIDTGILDQGLGAWMAYTQETGDRTLAATGDYNNYIGAFSQALDYSARQVTLDRETLISFLELTESLGRLLGGNAEHRTSPSLQGYAAGVWKPLPVQLNTLAQSLTYGAIAKAQGAELNMYPVRTMEGDYVAAVQYYAAVGADCEVPEIAYAFVRQFLTEEFQWERSRPREGQYPGLVAGSFPVRTEGAVQALWKNLSGQGEGMEDISLTEKDVPILQQEFSFARFPVPDTVYQEAMKILNGPDPGTPEAAAEAMLQQLQALFA